MHSDYFSQRRPREFIIVGDPTQERARLFGGTNCSSGGSLIRFGCVSSLQKRRREIKAKADNIAAAIAKAGPLESLLGQLSNLEREISQIDERLNELNNPLDLAATVDEVRRFVKTKMEDLKAVLRSDAITAREVLSRHIQRLVLTPTETPEGPVYGASGDVDLFGYEKDLVLMVARDGIGPPTGIANA